MIFSDRDTRSIVALAGGGLIVVLLGGVLVSAVGLRGAGRESTAPSTPITTKPRAADSASTTVQATAATSTMATTATVPPAAGDQPEVRMLASGGDAFASVSPIVDRLPSRSVLRISATGFETSGSGYVEQCTVGGCSNLFPVLFDENGSARLQYLVDSSFGARFEPSSTCRVGEPPCAVHLRGNGRSAFLTTVFGEVAALERKVTVEPGVLGLADGSRVRVSVTGFNPGERVQAMLCAAPDTRGSERCGAPGPVSSFTIGSSGAGRTTLVIRETHVGSARVLCGRGATCGIVVSHAGSSVPAPVVTIGFAIGPAARYDATRWLTGLSVAAVLLALAVFLVRGTDWRKPTEADTPDLDHAVLVGDEL
ncbi:MAG: Neocarzinostatin family [Actinomycetota bacterium]|nr:Neocarzinostatin family [Actinomycetota bacterium]